MKHLRFFSVALVLACARTAHPAQGADSPSKPETTSIGYSSVAEAIAALKGKPGVKFRTQEGMTIAEDFGGSSPTSWIFFPPTHPAYPSAIKRFVTNTANGAVMETRVRCEASKEVCDKYFGGK